MLALFCEVNMAQQYQPRKLFNVLKTVRGQQLFYRLYAKLILSYRHRRGAYLFSIAGAVNNFYSASKLPARMPDVVNIYFWQSGYDLGVIAKDSQTGKEVFIEL